MSSAASTSPLDCSLRVKGRDVTLRELAGPAAKAVLVVNVASQCGFTPQYKGLEQLYGELKERGLVVVGAPCNQFGAQEQGTDAEIEKFTCDTFKVSFPLTSKLEVNGPAAHPLYAALKAAKAGFLGLRDVKWNFEKFLVDAHSGAVVQRYISTTTPQAIKADIEKLLNSAS